MVWDKASILKRLEVSQRDEEKDVWSNNAWLNRDNVPLPPSRRTWGAWSFVGYWCATGINISGWSGGSSLLSLGLSVGQAMGVVVVGQFIVAGAVILTGLVGAKWHVGFPMWNRMTWGMRAAWFPLLNRIILSFTWYATQAWFGGQVVKTLLGSIWPSIYSKSLFTVQPRDLTFIDMKNIMPESTGMTSSDFLCFWIFLIISFPLVWIPPEHYRKPFLATSVISTICCFSLFIWSLARAHGAGPLVNGDETTLVGVAPVKGSALAWAFFYGISSQIGGICAGILNMSDYTRFAVKPGDQILSQAICVPVMTTLTCLIGIVCTSVGAQFYPDEGLLWNPYSLLTAIQKYGGNGARAAVFFCSVAFLISQLGINIAGNAIAGGIDLTSLFPKYLNIRRGAIITTVMALPLCPWALVSGATVYISVMGGYATFLGPMTGLMVFDYMFIRKQKMKLSSLYDGSPNSIYWYQKGVNWRAPVAWVVGVAPLFPGFLATVSTVTVPLGATHLYYLCFPAGFAISGTVYLALCKFFPLERASEMDDVDVYGTFGPAGEPYEPASAVAGAVEDLTHRPQLHVEGDDKDDFFGTATVAPVRQPIRE